MTSTSDHPPTLLPLTPQTMAVDEEHSVAPNNSSKSVELTISDTVDEEHSGASKKIVELTISDTVDEEHSGAPNNSSKIVELTISDKLGDLFTTAAHVIYRTARSQCDLYESAVEGRDVSVAIATIAPLVLQLITRGDH